jgi:Ca2+-binding EF-hand superfamily protein
MSSLTPEEHHRAEQAFDSADEGHKGYLHSKEFFYACQALGFNYTFVETFEMYKIYDDNNSLRMNLDEFKRFYAAKLQDPNSNVDPTKVSRVYTRNGPQGDYIPQSQLGTNRTVTSTTSTTNVGQYTTTNQVYPGTVTTQNIISNQPRVVRAGPVTTTTTLGAPVTTTYTNAPVTSYTTAPHTTTYTTAPHSTGYTTGPVTTYATGVTGLATVNSEMAKYDVEGKGYITREQLRVACKDLAVKCDTEDELDNIWNEIDNNGSGKINGIEFGEFYDYVRGFRDEVIQYQTQSQSGR